jgi:hypothetical protein
MATHFRLMYVDALRNSRWDEFTFWDAVEWQPIWVDSGVTVTSGLTLNWKVGAEVLIDK